MWELVYRVLALRGVELNESKNLINADIIYLGKVCIRVIPTNKALMTARLITRALDNS